jgi:uncharacterized protein (TIGR03435 family)
MQTMPELRLCKLNSESRLSLFAAGILAIAAPIAFCQSAATPPATTDAAAPLPVFDVVSVKPNKTGEGGTMFMFIPDGIRITGTPIQMLLREAFGVEDDRIFGAPGWVKSNRYDIEAKVEAADAPKLKLLKSDQLGQMLQPLLVDRFNLKFHHETRELPLYALVVAKGGLKMKASEPQATGPDAPRARRMLMFTGRGHLESQSSSVDMLLHILAQQTGRTIIDKTGLTGNYDYVLQWTPDDAPLTNAGNPEGGLPKNDASTPDSGPSIFTALEEQLGLKLESQKGPVDVIVIDHVEEPSEN